MSRSKNKNKRNRRKNAHGPRWFSRRNVFAVFAVAILAAGAIIAFDLRGLYGSKSIAKSPGWIIDGDQLQSLLAYTPSSLPETFFNNKDTVVLKPNANPKTFIPSGWTSIAGNHYTSLSGKDCIKKCYTFASDSKFLDKRPATIAMYDDEYWSRTPWYEQRTPCQAMKSFYAAAHSKGLQTIMAPDQDLAEPGIITQYQGGESENWQTYLRLGLGTCAAQSGTEWYHVMSQPYEAHWCGDLIGVCDSSESDFVNYVTQATLQAKSINPKLKVSYGLSTNPKYFGYFRGAGTLASIMYRDYADVQPITDSVWLNIVGPRPAANTTALYFLSTLSQHPKADRRSSVLFLKPVGFLDIRQPKSKTPAKFNLDKTGQDQVFVSNKALPAGSSLQKGTGEFQFWTDGDPSQNAQLGVNFGYCKGGSCSERTAVAQTSFWIHGNAKGAAAAGGAFSTNADTVLPKTGGPYHLYVRVTTKVPANFNLLYDSTTSPTNLATPVLQSM